MKKLSLVTQSLLTEFLYGLAFALVGVVRMTTDKGMTEFMPDWAALIVKVLFLILVAAPALERLFFSKRFDVWDETAKAHRMEAREITFLLLQIVMILVAVVLMTGQTNAHSEGVADGSLLGSTMTIDANFIVIAYGAIHMFQSLYFIYLEKRGA